MGRLLLIDDGPEARNVREYGTLLNNNELHYVFYLETMGGEEFREYTEKVFVPAFTGIFPSATVQIFSHNELIRFLKENQQTFEQIILDGLEGRCIQIIEEAQLPSDKTRIVTSNQDLIRKCQQKGRTCLDKLNLK